MSYFVPYNVLSEGAKSRLEVAKSPTEQTIKATKSWISYRQLDEENDKRMEACISPVRSAWLTYETIDRLDKEQLEKEIQRQLHPPNPFLPSLLEIEAILQAPSRYEAEQHCWAYFDRVGVSLPEPQPEWRLLDIDMLREALEQPKAEQYQQEQQEEEAIEQQWQLYLKECSNQSDTPHPQVINPQQTTSTGETALIFICLIIVSLVLMIWVG